MGKRKGFAGLPAGRRKFVLQVNELMNRAGELKLWRTMHALHEAKRILGWRRKSMSKTDGGPVFPSEQGHTPDGFWNQTWSPGMTLRDYFAAAALQSGNSPANAFEVGAMADWCYLIADAMLAERDKEG